MTDDILNTTQNPNELHRLAQELLTAQAREYEQRIRDLNAAMQAEKNAYEQRIREPEDALKRAQQYRFSRKSEAGITRQLSDLLPVKEKTGKKSARQSLPAHLPRQETVFMPETGCTCPDCGSTMRHIRNGVNEMPESVPAHFVVKRTVKLQYCCPCCEHSTVTAGGSPETRSAHATSAAGGWDATADTGYAERVAVGIRERGGQCPGHRGVRLSSGTCGAVGTRSCEWKCSTTG